MVETPAVGEESRTRTHAGESVSVSLTIRRYSMAAESSLPHQATS